MLNAIYHDIRNNHRIVYFLSVVIAIAFIIFELTSFVANNTALFDILGAKALKTRVIAAKETTYWHVRAWKNSSAAPDITPERAYGFLKSVNRDSTLNITIIRNNKYETQRIQLADIIVNNANGLAAIVEMHKSDNAEFDLYPTGQKYPYTVVWLDNEPFNLQIITAGIAKPDTTPPTNIVDRLFAEYYWKQLTN
ncbi:hypothetical protein [Janthinobacterium sp. CAN_S7]|uniref:hypothetical protein n=1 Tax=Janthinobacterium sp. CAN_S7 TaxID=3071704 RepID=UPI00319D8835